MSNLRKVLKEIHDSFSVINTGKLKGNRYSVSIMKPTGDVLKELSYYSDDNLFEPGADQFEFRKGEGFSGTAWERNYPQSGRSRKRFFPDSRYVQRGDQNNNAKSFFSTTIFPSRVENNRYVLNIASNHGKDFMWYQNHAKLIHYGLQPSISFMEYFLKEIDP